MFCLWISCRVFYLNDVGSVTELDIGSLTQVCRRTLPLFRKNASGRFFTTKYFNLLESIELKNIQSTIDL